MTRPNNFVPGPFKIESSVKMDLFRNVKFINSEEKALYYANEILKANPDVCEGWTDKKKRQWCITHNKFMCQTFNKERTNFGSRSRAAIKWWRVNFGGEAAKARGDYFPTYDDVRRCVMREVDLEVKPPEPLPEDWDEDDPENVFHYSDDGQLFYWYWDKLCAMCLGKDRFPANIRHYATLSGAKWHLDPQGKYCCMLWSTNDISAL